MPAAPPDCDALYFGDDRPRDLPAALACFRGREDWMMVTIMLLNGEGGPADVKGARAAFGRISKDESNADTEALGALLAKREASPKAAGRIDFCREVAQTTLSMNACLAREDRADDRRSRALVAKLRAGLAPVLQARLDEVATAAARVIEADGVRMYERYESGSIRVLASLGQQALVRKNYTGRVDAWLVRRARPEARRSFEEADRELNAVYKASLSEASDEYKKKARDPQRAWVRYRDGFAKLVSAVQPGARVDPAVLSLLTGDRVAELKNDPVTPE